MVVELELKLFRLIYTLGRANPYLQILVSTLYLYSQILSIVQKLYVYILYY